MKELKVNLKTNSYSIYIEKGLLQHPEALRSVFPSGRCCMITDTNVDPLYGEMMQRSLKQLGISSEKFVFPAGESSKTIQTLTAIYSFLAEHGFNRGDFILALGGGVVGDTAGFAAATYMRGIPYIGVPTTLLSQIDSSVGGKVAVDLPQGKNLIGNFYQPAAVLIDPLCLHTLPSHYYKDGMGELIKYACIQDKALSDFLLSCTEQELEQQMEELIYACVDIKRKVVEQDERDTGLRMILNFGHTIGHMIEKYYHYEGISHGEAVACGMYQITCRSEALGLTKSGTAGLLLDILQKYGLPYEMEGGVYDTLLDSVKNDKKNFSKTMNVIILKEIGSCEILPVPTDGSGKISLSQLFSKN